MENDKLKSRKFWLAVVGVVMSFVLILGGGLTVFDYLETSVNTFYWGLVSLIIAYITGNVAATGADAVIKLFKKQ